MGTADEIERKLKLRDAHPHDACIDVAYTEAVYGAGPALLRVVRAAQALLPRLPNMEPTGAAKYSEHLKAVMELRAALAALDGEGEK